MIKQLAIIIIQVFLATLIVYPFSSIVADILVVIWPNTLINTIIITLVRYIGFFFGIGITMFLYRGMQERQRTYYVQQGGYQ